MSLFGTVLRSRRGRGSRALAGRSDRQRLGDGKARQAFCRRRTSRRGGECLGAWPERACRGMRADLWPRKMGDFNSSPHSLPMKIMFSHANLIDTWTATHPPPPADPIGHNTHANAVAAMETFGLTVDTPLNTWSHGKPLDGFARRWLGKRLDYILYRSPAPKKAALSVQSTKIVMTDNVPGQNFSYSDHFGLEATFTVDLRGSVGHVGQANEPTVDASMKELSDEELLTALGALAFEYGSAKGRVQRHLACFGGCVAVLLLILLGSAWIKLDSRWAAPVATLLGAFVTWAGTTSLYVGLVYGRWETGILTNLMAEVEETRQRLPNAAHDM